MRKPILAAGAVALVIPGVALAASGPTIKASVKPKTPKAKSTLTVTANGPFGQNGLPTALQMNLQKGFKSSAKSVTQLCDTSMVPPAGPSGCPTASQIGSGTAVTDNLGTLTLTMYLGTKSQSTDIASVILSETNGLITANTVPAGRLFKTSTGQIEILFSSLPLGGNPAANLQSINFSAHAVNGTASLVKNPKTCPKSDHWKGTFTLSFTGGNVAKKLKLACKG
jgi:hypothetical protein